LILRPSGFSCSFKADREFDPTTTKPSLPTTILLIASLVCDISFCGVGSFYGFYVVVSKLRPDKFSTSPMVACKLPSNLLFLRIFTPTRHFPPFLAASNSSPTPLNLSLVPIYLPYHTSPLRSRISLPFFSSFCPHL